MLYLNSDDREIVILKVKYALPENSANVLVLILENYFSDLNDFSSSVNSFQSELNLNDIKAKEIILAGGILYYPNLTTVKQNEIFQLLQENKLDLIALKEQLTETEGKIIFPEELPITGINEQQEVIDIFQKYIKEALTSNYAKNRQLLNDILIEYLFTNGDTFKKELDMALKSNNELISQKNIIVNGMEVSPTVANWINDFEANNLLASTGALTAEYFNKSKNFNSLAGKEKDLIIMLLQLFRNLKNFTKIFTQTDTDQWYIIPPLPNQEEVEQSQKLADLMIIYNADLSWMNNKYQLEKNLPQYQGKSLEELLAILEKDAKNPMVVLPILTIINEQEPDFKSLTQSSLIKKIIKYKDSIIFLRHEDKHPLHDLLDYCEISNDESAMFVSHLASKNKNLMGLTYADLKDGTFKWR